MLAKLSKPTALKNISGVQPAGRPIERQISEIFRSLLANYFKTFVSLVFL